jgi:tripartite-type tricarboxylate transporter receptor subunit TctC
MKFPRRTLLHLAAGAVALPAVSRIARAQAYPTRPITIVVPFAAGGPADTLGRILVERMRASLGQPVIIENVAGAAGTIALARVARAAPDGYSVSIGNWGTHIVTGAVQQVPYDLLRDFEPVVLLPSTSYLIASKNAVPAKNLNELINWLRANEGKATSGTGGVGSANHVIGVYFQNITGTRFQFVPYRGGNAPAMQDLVAGHIDLIFAQPTDILPHVSGGKIRAYAVMAKNRLEAALDIPTVDEAGLPAMYASTWFGLWVPRGTPRDAVSKLNAAIVESLADPAVHQRISDLGLVIPSRDQQTPEFLDAFQRAEIEKWWPIIKAANIKAE